MATKRRRHSTSKQIQEAIDLLIQTDASYDNIRVQTGVSMSKITEMGKKYRSQEKRDRLRIEGQKKGQQMRKGKKNVVIPHRIPLHSVETEVVSNQPSESFDDGAITRDIAFKYSSSGKDIKVDEFIQELQGLMATLEESKNVLVDFSLTVQAK